MAPDRSPPPPFQDRRRGVAAVEFAVCLPLLLLLTFGMIETCSVIYLKQSMSVAAYEGGHTGVQPAATAADVRFVADAILAQRGVTGATVTVTPADLSGVAPGQYFTVGVSASADANAPVGYGIFAGRGVTVTTSFMKEL